MESLKKFKILYFINSLGSGGTERQLSEFLAGLDQNSVEPILVYYKGDNFYADKLREFNIPIFKITKSEQAKFRPWEIILFLRELIKIIKKNKIDIIHSYGDDANFWARIFGTLTKLPVIISLRNTKNFSFSRKKLEKLLAYFTDKIIVNTEAIKKNYLKNNNYPEENIVVINNGFNLAEIKDYKKIGKIEARELSGLAQDKFLITNIARISEEKNQLVILKAAKILKNRGIKNWEINLVGRVDSPDYFKLLQDFIKNNNLGKEVKFLGEQKNIFSILCSVDLFVLSSFREGFPNALAEAMAMGVLAISSAVDDIPKYLIENNKTGFLFSPQDPDELTQKIIQAIEMPLSEKEEIINRAQTKIAQEFSLEKLINKTIAVYQDLN